MSQSPLQVVKEKFGSKDKLVEQVMGSISKPEGEEDAVFRSRIASASNSKLMRMLARAEETKSLGGKDGMVKFIVAEQKRDKDKDYARKLGEKSEGQLLDLVRAAKTRKANAERSPEAKKALAKARSEARERKTAHRQEVRRALKRRLEHQKTAGKKRKK